MSPLSASRRRFLGRLGGLALGAMPLLVAACRIDRAADPEPVDPDPAGPDPLPDAVGFVSDNHQHDALITGAELEAGEAVVLHLQGHSQHDHFLPLTADDVAAIRQGLKLVRTSTNDWGHKHTVTFNRAA
jgi:hypothetical protein